MYDDSTTDPLARRLAADLDGAFPDFVRATQDHLYSGALRMLGNRADAEDVAQEALARAYRALAGYRPDRIRELRIYGWIWTIAANLCRNRLRSRRRKPTDPIENPEIAATEPGPEQQAVEATERDRLAARVAALPWAMRSALVLRHVVGLGYGDIAAALDRPVGTVKSDAHRGLARLRRALEREEP
jgi:RNA polymerase sigma-70 factor (ECF subfamily)